MRHVYEIREGPELNEWMAGRDPPPPKLLSYDEFKLHFLMGRLSRRVEVPTSGVETGGSNVNEAESSRAAEERVRHVPPQLPQMDSANT